MAYAFTKAESDNLSIADNAALSLGTALTLSAWFRLPENVGSAHRTLLGWGNYSSASGFVLIIGEASEATFANKLRFYLRDAAGDAFLITSSTTPGTSTAWQHVAIVRDGTTCKMYIGGSEVASETDATVDTVDRSAALKIGGPENLLAARMFGGELADIGKYDAAWDTDKISAVAGGKSLLWYPTSKAWHLPLLDNTTELVVPLSVTNNGATATTGPTLTYPFIDKSQHGWQYGWQYQGAC
jgi:hypothetical protein